MAKRDSDEFLMTIFANVRPLNEASSPEGYHPDFPSFSLFRSKRRAIPLIYHRQRSNCYLVKCVRAKRHRPSRRCNDLNWRLIAALATLHSLEEVNAKEFAAHEELYNGWVLYRAVMNSRGKGADDRSVAVAFVYQ